jgi:hypothetical protein
VLKSAAATVNDPGPQKPPGGGALAPDGPAGPTVDEFADIPSRKSRHPILAAAAVMLAAFLAFQLRHDLRYGLSSGVPRDLGDARSLAGKVESLPLNQYVRISGPADRESAVILDTQGEWQFSQFFRLLGTSSRVLVRRLSDPLPIERAEQDVFTGRLVRMADLSFAASIRRHFSTFVTATQLFAPEVFQGAAQGPRVEVMNLMGDPVTLNADDKLSVDLMRPGQFRIDLPRDRFPDLVRARAAVAAQGGEVVSEEPDGARYRTLVARFPDDRRDRALSALGDLDRRVRIHPDRTTTTVRVRDMAGLSAGKDKIQSVRTLASVEIPENAVLLLEGDRPQAHLKTLLVLAFLVAFAVVNLLALRRTS